MSTIKITTSDNVTFEVPEDIAFLSATIKTMVEDLGVNEIPVPNVNASSMKRVIEYAKNHQSPQGIIFPEVPEAEKYRTDNISEVDKKLVDDIIGSNFEGMADFFNLAMTANYLDIKPLLELCCKTISNLIKGRTPDEVKQIFTIPEGAAPIKV